MSTRIKVQHPEVGEVSLALGSRYYGDPQRDKIEIAFFDKSNRFYNTPVSPFEEYHDVGEDTSIYAWVPFELVEKWLAEHSAPTDIKSLPFRNDPDFQTLGGIFRK